MDRARHVCKHCGKIVNVTRGVSHHFSMAGDKYCTWCYNVLFFNDDELRATAVPYADFLKIADPKFIEEVIQRAMREGHNLTR